MARSARSLLWPMSSMAKSPGKARTSTSATQGIASSRPIPNQNGSRKYTDDIGSANTAITISKARAIRCARLSARPGLSARALLASCFLADFMQRSGFESPPNSFYFFCATANLDFCRKILLAADNTFESRVLKRKDVVHARVKHLRVMSRVDPVLFLETLDPG